MISIISIILAILVFLFVFYYYTREDLYFIKKGVSMEHLFNILFVGLFSCFIFSKLFYFLLNTSTQAKIFPWTVFISRPEGVSFFGGLFGLISAYLLLAKKRKISRKRFFDYIAVSLISSFVILFLGVFPSIYLFIMYLILFLFFISFLMPKYISGRLKPGSLILITFIMISLISFLQDIFLLYTSNILLTKESFLFLLLFFISLLLLIRSEKKKA